ncbi:hypothetical protein FE257_005377 [Aspergillus nanangensis]|uniref:Rhodopsin domain-containing protein n=1 Tax=Aspergillus nanangensis TaxID=2582783 RepID=A0AAD4CQG8_ASPNN|nr:hypothetical protein FE257_005377 [Aspergillus nanangensis]
MAVDRSLAVRAVAAVFLSLACAAVLLRCYVRIRLVRGFGWDDIIMLLATAFYIMFSACMIGGSLWGTGKHFTDLTAHQSVVAMKYWFLCDLGYALASILSKVSVCLLLLRVLIDPIHRAIIYVVTTITVITGCIFFVFCLVQCSPPSYFWTRFWGDETISGSCGNLTAIQVLLYLFSAVSATFDLTVAALPIVVVRRLQMSRQTKIAAVSLLGMACIASVAVIVRIPFVHTIKNPDFLYATVQIAIWSNIETGLSIFAGSLATLRPLFSKFTGSEVTARLHYNSVSAKLESSRRCSRRPRPDQESVTQLAELTRSAREREIHMGKHSGTASVHSVGDLSWQEGGGDVNTSIRVLQSWDVSSYRNSRGNV